MTEILLVCGSVRAGSGNETMLRTVADVAAGRAGGAGAVRTVFYQGLGALPHFNPDLDQDPLPVEVAELRAAVSRADALLICTPEYAGTLPGSFKNLLDWTVGGTETSDKPAAWINAAGPGRGGGAVATLRTVLEYTGAAIVDEACLTLPFDRARMTVEDGVIIDREVREQLAAAVAALVGRAA
jgi:NAD(P)H-dependent FMN reductase